MIAHDQFSPDQVEYVAPILTYADFDRLVHKIWLEGYITARNASRGSYTVEEFWLMVERTDTCWLWRGKTPRGYGLLTIIYGGMKKQTMLAHRLAYILLRGPIPAGLELLHSCDVRNCVNPDHLTPGTNLENMADMRQKGRQARRKGTASPQAKLTEDQVRDIRRRLAAREPSATLSREYGVSKGAIYAIKTGKNWPHLIDPTAPPIPINPKQSASSKAAWGHVVARGGRKQRAPHYAPERVASVRQRLADGASIGAITREFKMGRTTIKKIIEGRYGEM